MGKGDRRSRKSKIWRGTHGKRRPRWKEKRKKNKNQPKPAIEEPKEESKKEKPAEKPAE